MFYTYIYCNPEKPSSLHKCGFEPFYVGKGKNNRALAHLRLSDKDPNRHKANTIRRLLKKGIQPLIFISPSVDENSANIEEKDLITLYGRKDKKCGPLTNMSDGGEGQCGKICSEKTRKLLSAASSKAHSNGMLADNIKKWSTVGLAMAHTPEGRKKSAVSRTGLKRDAVTKQKMSQSRKDFISMLNDEERKCILGTMRGKKHPFTNTGGINPQARPVEYQGICYPSVVAAVEATGIHKRKLKIQPSFKYL